MDPDLIYKAIEIVKRDGRASVAVFKDELGLTNKEIQPILQIFYYTNFIGPGQVLSSLKEEERISRLEADKDQQWKKKKEYEAWLAGAVLTIFVLFGALFI